MIYTDILNVFSPYLIAFLVAYLITEGIKIIIITSRHHKLHWREFFKSGGMPSSHSADITALATTIGLLNGFGSGLFALAVGFASIVIYDAMHVRRATGEQGEVIKKIIERDAKLGRQVSDLLGEKTAGKLREPYFSRGHKPIEVLVGGLIGIAVGIVVAYLSVC
ncbi:divergent PAP2 family protein [Candidatus Saccharibacteria bacterium]|nr:divergent PAP2 family protein [Candidatus Saccharibacteria bacterium]